MNDKHLHIISFDVPYPPNYGGIIDVFYKQKWLEKKGVKVHLHCFEYGRGKPEALNACHEVHYYHRDTTFRNILTPTPYIVASRRSSGLVNNLLHDDYPILCEGLHTTSIMRDKRFKDRKIFVRAHNVEHDYYRLLADSEPKAWKRLFLRQEAKKLLHYEAILKQAQGVFTVTQKDTDYFTQHYENVLLVPSFNSFDEIAANPGKGSHVLYHGNLSVAENVQAAEWLIHNLFSKLDFPCIIAGLNPPTTLKQLVSEYGNIRLIANPNDAEMQELLKTAQANVLVTDQPTGLKLKLLNALYNGRFCVVNANMVAGTGLADLCIVSDTPDGIINALQNIRNTEFTIEEIARRDAAMKQLYDNSANADKLIRAIFE